MSKNQFRLLLTLNPAILILTELYNYFWPNPVVESVSSLAKEMEQLLLDEHIAISLIILLGVLSIFLVSYVGLYFFKSWAKKLYLLAFFIILPLYLFLGVHVASEVSQLGNDISMICYGASLALLFFSPVSEYYTK